MNCIRCGTTLYDTDPAPHCDLCLQIEQEASAQYEAERDAMRRQAERARLSLSPAQAPAPAQAKRDRLDRALQIMQRPQIIDGQQWESVTPEIIHQELAPAPHTELTPAGVAYLLPGIEPVHKATQPPGQARLL